MMNFTLFLRSRKKPIIVFFELSTTLFCLSIINTAQDVIDKYFIVKNVGKQSFKYLDDNYFSVYHS